MKPEGRKRTNQPQVLIKGKIGTVRIREREGGKGSGWDQTETESSTLQERSSSD